MTSRVDRILEAVYSFVPEEEWLEGVVHALEPFSLSQGVLAYTSTLADPIAMRALVNRSTADTEEARKVTLQPPPFYRRVHAPLPLSFSQRVFEEIAVEFGLDLHAALDSAPYRTPPAMWGLCGGDAGVESALVVFVCKDGEEHSARDKHTLDCVGAHISSALRLRSLLPKPDPSEPVVEAVLDPNGKVLDARSEAREGETQALLIDALRRSEKARLRRASPEERLEVWKALVECRWSLLENVERDGKRTILVCRNEPRTAPLRTLTSRETSVATYVALGHSYKYIAYELGIPVSTIAALFQSAMRKLGVKTRAELVQILSWA